MTLPSSQDSTDTRLHLLKAWLQGHAAGYALALDTLVPASSDASFRRYFRVAGKAAEGENTGSLIAVDAPPPEKCREFVQIAQLLDAAGVHVPRVLEVDFDAGLMLVTDLGTDSYLRALLDTQTGNDPRRARTLMRDALDALIRWQLTSREGVLPAFEDAPGRYVRMR